MSDNDVLGLVERLIDICQTPAWIEFWQNFDCTLCTFADFQLPTNASDATVWQTCQDNELILITANRNKEGSDSLETAIGQSNRPNCLPVLTLADPKRVGRDRAYAEAVVERLLDILDAIDNDRGTGRLYLP
jgi:hypothetical protein